jgi:ectoine hydroxylase-related dioxygenase (phytanoyl-CoA dioxygenase family)
MLGGMTLEAHLDAFRRDGYVILPRIAEPRLLADLRAALARHEADRPMGRNDFEGERSQRVYSLAGKGPAFCELATHPAILALLDRLLLPNYLLSTLQSIRLHPGETVQPWHTDDLFYLIPRPRPLLGVSVIWAIEDFTEDNGATEVIPGSHRWADEHPDDAPRETVAAVMPAGSAIVFDPALWHRGGANRSRTATRLAISPQYCQPWLRQQESQLLIVPPAMARTLSDRMRSLIGYSIHPPFLGQVEGMHPLRLVDDAYRERKTHDHAVADQMLARPVAPR